LIAFFPSDWQEGIAPQLGFTGAARKWIVTFYPEAASSRRPDELQDRQGINMTDNTPVEYPFRGATRKTDIACFQTIWRTTILSPFMEPRWGMLSSVFALKGRTVW
jgi:hypothetical protein